MDIKKSFFLISMFMLISLFILISMIFNMIYLDPYHPFFKPNSSSLDLVISNINYRINNTRNEFGIYVKFNKYGFKDYNYPIKKKSNTTRIAIIGDSFTYGLGLNTTQTYENILEIKINKSNNVEIINFAIDGFNSYDQFIILKKDVLKFEPDILMVAYATNDPAFSKYNIHPYYCINLGNQDKSRDLVSYFKIIIFSILNRNKLKIDEFGVLHDENYYGWQCTRKIFKELKKNFNSQIIFFIIPDPIKGLDFTKIEKEARLNDFVVFNVSDPFWNIVDIMNLSYDDIQISDRSHFSEFGNKIIANILEQELKRYDIIK
jgi:hypothetical protein